MSRIRLYWHYDQYTSFRDSAKEFIAALRDVGIELENEPYSSNIVVVQGSPETILECFETYPELRNRCVVGFVQWEANQLKNWQIAALSKVNEIWTSSEFCRRVFRQYFPKVVVIPHIVNSLNYLDNTVLSSIEDIRSKSELSPFLFYSIVNKVEPRKNLEAIAKAFSEAGLGSNAHFIVKTTTHAGSVALPRNSKFVQINTWLTKAEMAALHRECHVYVSAHRGEGWGLGLSDAMSHGNLVVATNFSGNTHYMNENNSLLVDYELLPISRAAVTAQPQLWSRSMQWAEISLEDLVEKLRLSYYQYNSLQHLRARAEEDMKQFTPAAVGEIIVNEVERIYQSHF